MEKTTTRNMTDTRPTTKYGTEILHQTEETTLGRRRQQEHHFYQANRAVLVFACAAVAFIFASAFKQREIGRQGWQSKDSNMIIGPLLDISSASLPAEYLRLHSIKTEKHDRSLLLLRHAESSWDKPSLTDDQRPLAKDGIETANRLGLFLKETKVPPPQIIIASPSVRTRSTLDLVQMHWAVDIPIQLDAQLYSLAMSTYLGIVRHLDSRYNRIMLVGHNPAMNSLVQQLVADQHLVKKFPPCAFLEIHWTAAGNWSTLEEGNGTGVLFVPPKSIK
jgi:phosphohistidine phosphatase